MYLHDYWNDVHINCMLWLIVCCAHSIYMTLEDKIKKVQFVRIQPMIDSWTGVLVMWHFLLFWQSRQHSYTASPLISFQSPSAEFRLTLGAMALRLPVWKDWTSATVLAPRVTASVILPRELILPWDIEEPLPWLDLQSAAVFVVVENFPGRWETLIWPRRELVAGFLTSGRLPGVKICLNLTPAPWKLARTRDRGPVHRGTLQYEKSADICCAMPEQNRQSNGLCWSWFAVITVSDLAAEFRFRFVVVQVLKSTGYHVPYLFWKLTCGMYHLQGVG